jgi:hypothetical protein
VFLQIGVVSKLLERKNPDNFLQREIYPGTDAILIPKINGNPNALRKSSD